MNQTNRLFAKAGLLPTIAIITFALPAFGNSHSDVSVGRDGATNNMYISQSLDGEYGNYNLSAGGTPSKNSSNIWTGTGLTSSVGLEWMKFIQLGLSHTLLNVSERDNTYYVLQGSRVSADLKMIFYSPIGSVVVGGGALTGVSNIHYDLTNTSYMGRGYYSTLGINYFVSSRVSLQVLWKDITENYLRSSGATTYNQVYTHVNSVGLGFDIWL